MNPYLTFKKYLSVNTPELTFWWYGVISTFAVLLASKYVYLEDYYEVFYKDLVPICICLVFTNLIFSHINTRMTSYGLFFSITIASCLGLSKTLTGSHAEVTNVYLYGLSFYSASLAFLMHQKNVTSSTPWTIANPLLLATGPVAIYVKKISAKRFSSRFYYYFPYVILGLFLYQAVAAPLTETFFLLRKTDVVSSIVFAIIFELFVYANFCGLSLMIFGLAGVLGYKVPLNFRQPFSATNIVDFWKGWHISLSAVLKQLFYVPLRSRFPSAIALFGVFISSAMWHGVALNFLIWGSFHAVMFILTVELLKKKIPFLPTFIFIIAVVLGRMLFADTDNDRLWLKLHFSYEGIGSALQLLAVANTTKLALALVVAFVAMEFFFQKARYFRGRNYKFYRLPLVQLIILMITLAIISADMGNNYAVYGQR